MRRNRYLTLLCMIWILLILLPITTIGVMHNDELLARYWSMQGVQKGLAHFFDELLIVKGRAMSCLVIPFTQILGYIGKSRYCFRILQVLTVISNFAFFSKLVYKLFDDKKLSYLVLIFLPLFLAISFEPTLPNAYVTLYGIPLTLLFISMLQYLKYLETNKKSNCLISLLLLWIACCSYEAFITYVPVYLILTMVKLNAYSYQSIKKNIKYFFIPIGLGIIFLLCYIITGKIFPSQYEGTQINFNIFSSLIIIKALFCSCLPGGLLLSNKYKFLYNYYKYDISGENIIRVIVVLIITVFFLREIMVCEEKKDLIKNFKKELLIICSLLFCIILPFLPISISKMYQGNVGENGFVALPVSYFSYFVAVLLTAYITRNFLLSKKNMLKSAVVIICIIILGGNIQIYNSVFEKQMEQNFDRIENIEDLFKTTTMNNYRNTTICSEDIFITYNTLAVHDTYWSDYTKSLGKNIIVKKQDGGYINIYETTENVYTLEDRQKKTYIIFSKKLLNNRDAVKIGKDKYTVFEEINPDLTNGKYYVYLINAIKE